jgi:hypothetical protein
MHQVSLFHCYSHIKMTNIKHPYYASSIFFFKNTIVSKFLNFFFILLILKLLPLVCKFVFFKVYSIVSSSYLALFRKISYSSLWIFISTKPSIYHMMFNKVKDGKTWANKMSYKQRFWSRVWGGIWNVASMHS